MNTEESMNRICVCTMEMEDKSIPGVNIRFVCPNCQRWYLLFNLGNGKYLESEGGPLHLTHPELFTQGLKP